MTECSQEFKDMLEEFYAEAYEDGKFGCDPSLPARGKAAAILQYMAGLRSMFMAECSQEFKDMLSKYKSDVHHECLLIDDFLADTGPILQYVAKLEAAYTAPAPAHAVPDADGARFRWLCEDHSARVARERCRGLIDRLPVMSYSDAVMSIDAAMVGGMPEWPST